MEKKKLLEVVRKIIVEKLHGTIPEEDEKKNCDPVLDMDYDAMSPLIHKIVMMVRVEYGGHISLKSIADKFRMNSTYLGQIFIKETGMKFSEYLMCYRLYVARERILNSDEKIAVIAADVGYSNMNYFYQHFHGYYHTTPSDMRMKVSRGGNISPWFC
ncbi:MAG: helix-turn-helix transcriptional regulator [Eisenbergiella sp.]